MEKIILTIWILWVFWGFIQKAYSSSGGIWFILFIASCFAAPFGVIWVVFFWGPDVPKYSLEALPLIIVSLALISLSIRLFFFFRGLRLSAQYHEIFRAERERKKGSAILHEEDWNRPSKAISRHLFGHESLIPRFLTLLPVLLPIIIWENSQMIIAFFILLLILWFVWIFTAVGSTVSIIWGWTFRSLSYGDSGYGDFMDKWRNIAFLCGEALLPGLIWLTLITEPFHSLFLYAMPTLQFLKSIDD